MAAAKTTKAAMLVDYQFGDQAIKAGAVIIISAERAKALAGIIDTDPAAVEHRLSEGEQAQQLEE